MTIYDIFLGTEYFYFVCEEIITLKPKLVKSFFIVDNLSSLYRREIQEIT